VFVWVVVLVLLRVLVLVVEVVVEVVVVRLVSELGLGLERLVLVVIIGTNYLHPISLLLPFLYRSRVRSLSLLLGETNGNREA
jgi:hypothetical protein